MSIAKGKLYLVPAPLDFGCDAQAPLQEVMPLGTLQIAARLCCWICENAKSTRAYLKRINELLPAIADPGSSVVRAAHDLDLEVVALTGPMSLMLALASSGLNGQNFAFVGYLPQDPSGRAQRIRELESLALKTGQTQLFIETPYRNAALLQGLLQTLHGNTRLALSCGLTLTNGVSRSAQVSQWKRDKPVLPLDLPTVFCIGR